MFEQILFICKHVCTFAVDLYTFSNIVRRNDFTSCLLDLLGCVLHPHQKRSLHVHRLNKASKNTL